MAKGPWTVLGPAVGSQTADAIKRRYLMSFVMLGCIFGPIFAVVVGVQLKVGEIGPLLGRAMDAFSVFAAQRGAPVWVVPAASFLVPCLILAVLFNLAPVVVIWLELKIAAHIQVRMGPMWVGRFHGILQPVADGLKLMLKEDIVPAEADRWIHYLAPVVVLVPAFVAYAPVSFGPRLVGIDLDTGTLFVMAVSGLSTLGLLMAGWASQNKYSALGGLRAAAQTVSYEIPRVLSLLPVVMWAGTLSLSGIARAQEGLWMGILPKWFIFYPGIGLIAYVIYFICTVAETNRTPFDIAEAESELVSGFNTEYSGMKFALFFLAEYAYVFLGAAVGTDLFFGGGSAPWNFLRFIPSYVWFIAKTLGQVFLIILVRWTYPRIRVDRLMEFCWKFLVPWSLVNVALAGALILWRAR
jgi:NADH-quinone oxidoreductase subunit H